MPTLAIELFVSVVTVAWTLPVGAAAVVAVVTLAGGLAVLLSARRAVFRTTLVSAWWWAVAALVAWGGVVAAVAVWGGELSGSSWNALRLAAIGLSLCPVVALLGAKRPQDGPWNFVVLSLWGIVALPAAESLLARGGQSVEVGVVRSWFLWVLILLGPINFVPTRFWLAALMLAAGQMVGLSKYLALVNRPLVGHAELIGLLLAAGALVVAWLTARSPLATTNAFDRMWLEFRNSFGLLWGLRVQERVNASATQYGWDFVLTWNGFRRRGTDVPLTDIDEASEAALRATMQGLLRRFEAVNVRKTAR